MKIAIVGGGFSAISLSLQIVSKANTPLSLYICEKDENIGLGTAYATQYSWHLLNVRAAQMGAASDDPEGFFNWLQNNESSWQMVDPAFKELSINKEAFLPRKLYGCYLSALLKEIKSIAVTKNIHFEIVNKAVIELKNAPENEISIVFSDHQLLNIDKVVLATGVYPIRNLPFVSPSSGYIANLWELDKQDLIDQISFSTKDSVIFIIGTGLTTVDLLTSLDKLDYPGKIIALSRHGQLPATHQKQSLPPLGDLNQILFEKTLLNKIRAFRKQLKGIESGGGNWVQLFETLRPATYKLWQQLAIQDKKRFLKYCIPLWNTHRHRMPYDSKRLIENLLQKGKLRIMAGKIISIQEKNLLEIHYKQGNAVETLQADLVFNCTGPDYTLTHSADPLIQDLLNKGWIIPDPLGMGIKCDSNFCVEGPLSRQIYAMGALLFGECFETTAVPDIRNHAYKIASQLLVDA
ncbi:MAG: FAD/NAD(P)-binding protein [Parachlamydiaceae bacterium]|nr:FAD/NAD(P)-binding protein [Parachlamydiaceae bacterium]